MERGSGSPPTSSVAAFPSSDGVIARILDEPSCSVLELEDGTLVPFISDAIERVDLEAREIHVNRDFLG